MSMVTLTANALTHIKKKMTAKDDCGVRLSMKKTGCSGYKPVLDFVQAIPTGDDAVVIEEGITLYIDKNSLEMVKGMEIDYVLDKESLSSHFQFSHPKQQNVCGCGESFVIGE